jgi:hypothetical protein
VEFKCPARESSVFLCDRVAEYQINGTVWCNTHARRILEAISAEEDDLNQRQRSVKVREWRHMKNRLTKGTKSNV